MFDKFKEQMADAQEQNIKEGRVDPVSKKEAGYKHRLQNIDEHYHAGDEGREREFEYKTVPIVGYMGQQMSQLDVLLNEEAVDGWRFARALPLDEFGMGSLESGYIFIFERPVASD